MEGTRGEQFLRLRRLELQEFIAFSKVLIANWQRSVELYDYTKEHKDEALRSIAWYEREIFSAQQDLEQMKGAENEEPFLTDRTQSESPQMQEIDCTTVL